jgi:hypothetical protein
MTSQLEGSELSPEHSSEHSADGAAEDQKSAAKQETGENDREQSRDLLAQYDAGMHLPQQVVDDCLK